MSLFLSTFSLVFLAELPDKTALATLLLAAKGGKGAVFTGVALAFLVQCLIAVAVGGLLGKLPPMAVKTGTGILFLLFAFLTFQKREGGEEKESDENGGMNGSGKKRFLALAGKAFFVIFVAEWGDLTQLTTASLSARYQEPLTIFSASLLALWSVTALAVILGEKIGKLFSPRKLLTGSSVLFALMGLWFLYEALV